MPRLACFLVAGVPFLAGIAVAQKLKDAASALAAGDLAAAETSSRAAYDAGDRTAPLLMNLARLALWRNELDRADKLARQIDSSAPESKGAESIEKAIALRRSDAAEEVYRGLPNESVSVLFLALDPLPTLVGKINGREAGFIIDTGADQLVVDSDLARELKMKADGAQTGTFAGGKTASIAHAIADEVELGQLKLSHVPATILPTRRFTGFAHQVDAIIGTRFLSRFLATIDYPHSRLILAPRNAGAVPNGLKLPMWWIGDHYLYASGLLNGKNLGMWLVDTGLAGGGLMVWNNDVLAGAGISLQTDKTTKGQGGGGEVTVTDFVAPSFALGTASSKNVAGKYIPGSPIGAGPPFKVAGIVSHEFFKTYALTLDFDRMQLVLSGERPTR